MSIPQSVCLLRAESSRFLKRKIENNEEHFAKYLPDYKNLDELKAHYERGGLGDVKVKKFLNNVLQETLEPIRLRRKELENNKEEIMKILFTGSDDARKAASENLTLLKKAMGIDYRN